MGMSVEEGNSVHGDYPLTIRRLREPSMRYPHAHLSRRYPSRIRQGVPTASGALGGAGGVGRYHRPMSANLSHPQSNLQRVTGWGGNGPPNLPGAFQKPLRGWLRKRRRVRSGIFDVISHILGHDNLDVMHYAQVSTRLMMKEYSGAHPHACEGVADLDRE